MIAKDFQEFVKKIVEHVAEAANSELGQEVTKRLLIAKAKQNPNLTPEEWEKTKEQFMIFAVYQLIKNVPEVGDEFSGHLYRELRNI